MAEATIAVTGATGLVGFHVCEHFARQGRPVVAICRRESPALTSLARSSPLTIVQADLFDEAGLAKAMTGADVVVHAAGAVDPLGVRAEIMRVNVGGTRSALSAAVMASVKHFIHISSLSTITAQGDQYDVDESAPLRYCGEAYADSKVDAEKLVAAEFSSSRIAATILRPGFIYGAGERAWLPRLIASLKSGKAMLIDGGSKDTNVIFVGNLCRAVALAALNERAYGQVYNLTDGEKVSKQRLFNTVASGLQLPAPTKRVPGFIAGPFCEAVSTLAPVLPEGARRALARYSRAAYRLAGINQGFSIKKAESELGYVDRISFAEGMAQTLAHFRDGQTAESIGEVASR